MEVENFANFIKIYRKEKGLTQQQLAELVGVTEKAVSKWETGRGMPDISLLIPISEALGVKVSELLNGECETVIDYELERRKKKYNWQFKLTVSCFLASMMVYLFYLKVEYSPYIEMNYFYRLGIVVLSMLFAGLGGYIGINFYLDKIEEQNHLKNVSLFCMFGYYVIMLFNMSFFARYTKVSAYNLVPFQSIIEVIKTNNVYDITINLLGNLVVFMPVVFFLIELFEWNRLKEILVIAAGISTLTEMLQFLFSLGTFDVDDIILNVCGMVLFYFVYINSKKKWRKRHAKINDKNS